MTNARRSSLQEYSGRLAATRLILIIAVVYMHVPVEIFRDPALLDPSKIELVLIANMTAFRFAVSILTVMSGFILFETGGDRKGLGTVRKKFRTLIIPFMLWNIPLALAMFVAQSTGMTSGQRLDLVNADFWLWMDALFSLNARPINYPLYFLRDLFIINVIAVAASGIIRRHIFVCLVVAALIAEYDVDGMLLLRSPMLPAFMVGAALSIWKANLGVIDHSLPIVFPAFLVACLIQHYAPVHGGGTYVAALGAASIWSLTAYLEREGRLAPLVRLSKYAFPIYLMHGPVLVIALAMGVTITHTFEGLILWLLLPPAICLACCLGINAARSIAPRTVSFATGGRGA